MEVSLVFMSIISSHYFDSKKKFIFYMVLIKPHPEVLLRKERIPWEFRTNEGSLAQPAILTES